MAEFFDEDGWKHAITKLDWYQILYPELKLMREKWEATKDTEEADRMKREVRGFFSDALESGRLALGSNGVDFDAERKPVDMVVIHHTSAPPDYDLSYMNATQLLNVYVPYYADTPPEDMDVDLHGKPMWSNHIRHGKPVFYLYHWLLRMDGTTERLLDDNQIGWHAANWDINCRSIGICLDNDYEKQDPTPEIIERLAAFISEQYPSISPERIVGHGEVSRHPTVCPGGGFTSHWKQQLAERLQSSRS